MGSVMYRDGSWVAVYYDKELLNVGIKKRRWKRGFSTKEDAQKFVSIIESQDYIIEVTGYSTFKEFSQHWIDDYAKLRCAESTLTNYVSRIEKDMIPFLGKKKIIEIDINTIRQYYKHLRNKKCISEHTILHHHRLLHTMFEKAVDWGLIPTNPVSKGEAPKKEPYEASIWDEDEIKKVKAILANSDYRRLELPVLFALYLGMRRGEIMALQYNDIDFKKKLLSITHSLELKDGKWELKTPKTKSSRRIINIPDELISKLERHRNMQNESRLKHEPDYHMTDFIFTDEKGNLISPDYITKTFGKFVKKNKLKHITFHGLRHTFCSEMIRIGIDPRTVQAILGHSTIDLSLNVYTHTSTRTKEEAIKKYANSIG